MTHRENDQPVCISSIDHSERKASQVQPALVLTDALADRREAGYQRDDAIQFSYEAFIQARIDIVVVRRVIQRLDPSDR